jgi:hypothetical protein
MMSVDLSLNKWMLMMMTPPLNQLHHLQSSESVL